MKRAGLFLGALGMAAWIHGQTIFDSSAASYTAGDLAGQNNWAPLLNYDTNGIPVVGSGQLGYHAFDVDNSDWIDTAGTDSDFLATTNGSFVFLDEASAGNGDDLTYTFTIDFNLSLPELGAGGIAMPNSECFYLGLTARTNGSLSRYDVNDACFILRPRAEAGRLDVQFQNGNAPEARLLRFNTEHMGWAPEAVYNDGTPVTADYQTDDLRLVLNLRKSRNADTYVVSGLITNLTQGYATTGDSNAGTSNSVIVNTFCTGVYASNDVRVAFGRSSQAYNVVFGGALLDIDIDAFSVTTSSVPPAAVAPQNVNAAPYDGQVILVWDAVNEVGSYNVLRSTMMGGPYTTITNLAGLGLVDTAVVNGTTYYYVIQSVFPGVGTADSFEVFARPQLISTGILIDTDFSFYSSGDLAGQNGWLPVSGSSNNAFNVINAGTVTAAVDTVSTAASFSTNVGNAVYLDKLTDNAVYDAWEGHIDFQVSSAWTNINNQDVFVFGVTTDPTAPLFLQSDDNMALMSLKVRANGKLVAMFGDENNDTESTRLAVLIGQGETGWDPPTGDLLSDVIRYNWKIRKSGVDGTYQAFGSFSNMTQSVTNPAQVGAAFLTKVKQGLYDSPSANFAMGHYYKAKLTPADELVNVTIFDMSVAHTSDNLPSLTAPTVATEGTDRTVTVSWSEAFEQSGGYDLLFSETEFGAQIQLTNTTGLGYVDTPRFNGITNWYAVRATFPAGTATSDPVPGLPFAGTRMIDLDGTTGAWSGTTLDPVTGLQTNSGITYIDYSATPYYSPTLYPSVGEETILYGLSQVVGVYPDLILGTGQTWRYNIRSTATDEHFQWSQAAGTTLNQLRYVKSTDMAVPAASIDLTDGTHVVTLGSINGVTRLAIRNSGVWYVSQTTVSGSQFTFNNLVDAKWAAVTITPGVAFTTPGTFTADTSTFTSVDAIGWYVASGNLHRHNLLVYDASGSPPSIDYWAGNNSVTNLYGNNDGDALINIEEYAFGYNPNIPGDYVADDSRLPNYTKGNYLGTDGFFVVHVELRDPKPGIDYSLETAADLAFPVWGAEGTVVGEANVDYYFKAVTNFIPADVAAKFIDLIVTEMP